MQKTNNFKYLNSSLDINKVLSGLTTVSQQNTVICPFHADTNPSMYIYKDSNTLFCFACKTYSDIIGYYAKIKNVDLLTSAINLSKEYGIPFKSAESIDNAYKEKLAYLDKCIGQLSPVHIEYLKNRGIEDSSIKMFKIGADGEYIIQPIFDENNKIKFFNKRSIINKNGHHIDAGADKNSVLGGLNIVKGTENKVIVTEGFFDVMQAWQEGYACVNVFGSKLSEVQAEKLLNIFSDIVLAFDYDEAGISGSLKAIKTIKSIKKSAQITFADFDTKDLGEHLYNNSIIPEISFYEWAKKANISYTSMLEIIKYSLSLPEKRLCVSLIAKDNNVTSNEVFKELELV